MSAAALQDVVKDVVGWAIVVQRRLYRPGDRVTLGIHTGDIIDIDANAGTMSVRLSDEELAARRAAWAPRRHDFQSGAIWRYAQTVRPARYEGLLVPAECGTGHKVEAPEHEPRRTPGLALPEVV
jgi:hypothetical protein